MRLSGFVSGLLLLILGIYLGWWISDLPTNQFDEKIRFKYSSIEESIDNVIVPLFVGLTALLLLLKRRGG